MTKVGTGQIKNNATPPLVNYPNLTCGEGTVGFQASPMEDNNPLLGFINTNNPSMDSAISMAGIQVVNQQDGASIGPELSEQQPPISDQWMSSLGTVEVQELKVLPLLLNICEKNMMLL